MKILGAKKMESMTKMMKIAATQLLAVIIFLMFSAQAFAGNVSNVNYRRNSFITNDSIILNYRAWSNPNSRAVIVFLSGLQSHSQWFNDDGDYLYSKGYNVYALDRRGSGLSEGNSGDIIFYQTWINDLHQFITFVKKQHPGLPVHLMANCFGTRITLGYSLQYPFSVKSNILLTPGLFMNVDVSSEDKLKVVAQTTEKIDVPITDSMFTSDPLKLNFMKNDNLMLREVTARMYMQSELLSLFVQMSAPVIVTPTLVLMSSDDAIVSAAETKNSFYNLLPCRKKLVEYQGVKHYLLFENSRQAVLTEIINWVK